MIATDFDSKRSGIFADYASLNEMLAGATTDCISRRGRRGRRVSHVQVIIPPWRAQRLTLIGIRWSAQRGWRDDILHADWDGFGRKGAEGMGRLPAGWLCVLCRLRL